MQKTKREREREKPRKARRTTSKKRERAKRGQETMAKETKRVGRRGARTTKAEKRARWKPRGSSTCDSATYTRSILWVYVVSVSQFWRHTKRRERERERERKGWTKGEGKVKKQEEKRRRRRRRNRSVGRKREGERYPSGTLALRRSWLRNFLIIYSKIIGYYPPDARGCVCMTMLRRIADPRTSSLKGITSAPRSSSSSSSYSRVWIFSSPMYLPYFWFLTFRYLSRRSTEHLPPTFLESNSIENFVIFM